MRKAVPSAWAARGRESPSSRNRQHQHRVRAKGTAVTRGPVHNHIETSAVIGLYVGRCWAVVRPSPCYGTNWPSGPTASRATRIRHPSLHKLSSRRQEAGPRPCVPCVASLASRARCSSRDACVSCGSHHHIRKACATDWQPTLSRPRAASILAAVRPGYPTFAGGLASWRMVDGCTFRASAYAGDNPAA